MNSATSRFTAPAWRRGIGWRHVILNRKIANISAAGGGFDRIDESAFKKV